MKFINDTDNNSKRSKSPRIAISIAALAIACFEISNAGIGRLGVSSGRISQFGSIFVNNRELDISTAAITLDGQAGSEAELKLGQVVFVRGVFDDAFPEGIAAEVVFNDNVEGPITSIDASEGRLVVLGQVVLANSDTVFDLLSDPDNLEGLDVNDQIEVSGFLTANGDVFASRIEEKAPGGQHEVTGVVSNLSGSTFELNTLTVEFSGAVLRNFPGDSISDGDKVEAKGVIFSGVNGELTASEVELQVDFAGLDEEVGEFEGLITEFESAESFSIAEVPVSIDEDTVFIGGGVGNLMTNTDVEVAGEFDSAGNLVADRVTLRGTRIRFEGPVDSVSVDSESEGSLTVLGITAIVDSTTQLEDKSSEQREPFKLSDLYASAYVELRSFNNPAESTPFLAERVTRENPESDVRLQGFVDSVSTQYFDIHGVTIEVDQNTSFSDATGTEISESEFFEVLTTGTFVKVHGTETTGTGIMATQVDLALDN